MRERLRLKRKRDEALRAKAKVARQDRLCPADQMLAETVRLPRSRAERVALAHSLVTAGDRKRTKREIAAIMGLSLSAVKAYFKDPEGQFPYQKAHEKRKSEGTAVEPHTSEPEPPVNDTDPLRHRGESQHATEYDGEWIRRRRKALKMSMTYLAAQLKVPVAMVREWESDKRQPSPAYVARLRQILL